MKIRKAVIQMSPQEAQSKAVVRAAVYGQKEVSNDTPVRDYGSLDSNEGKMIVSREALDINEVLGTEIVYEQRMVKGLDGHQKVLTVAVIKRYTDKK